MITVYSKENCSKCVKAEFVLRQFGYEFEVKKLNVDYTRELLEKKFEELGKPMPRSLPVVFNDALLVGGLTEVEYQASKGIL